MNIKFEPGIDPNEPVAISKAGEYDADQIEALLRRQLTSLGISDMFEGRSVVIKPNLVMKKAPGSAAVTHPVLLEAMIRILSDSASEIVIAESPPGLYTPQALRGFYTACGIDKVADKYGARLNYDTSAESVSLPDARTSHMFGLISPILEADAVVNLAKLKSHALTKYSGAVKNYFGCVPGVQKVECHARFPDYNVFASMLDDLAAYIAASKPTFNVVDGILAMEGNGPTGGDPVSLGLVISGRNPFNVDCAAAKLIGWDNIPMLDEAERRGYCRPDPIELRDGVAPDFHAESFRLPDSIEPGKKHSSSIVMLSRLCGGRIYKWISPRPEIDNKICVGCGECARACPKKTIELVADGKKRKARVNIDGCIRCYCCQELCMYKAVKIRKNPIFTLLGG